VEVVIAISTEIMWGGINLCDDQYTIPRYISTTVEHAHSIRIWSHLGKCDGELQR
jgi:hypothetical protein